MLAVLTGHADNATKPIASRRFSSDHIAGKTACLFTCGGQIRQLQPIRIIERLIACDDVEIITRHSRSLVSHEREPASNVSVPTELMKLATWPLFFGRG